MREQLSKKEREEFVKHQLEYFYEMSHPKWGQVLKFSFIKGIATGFGIFLGGTLLIALLLWILNLVGNIGFLNDITDAARQSLDQSN